jgi:hypothetical protein
MSKHSIKTQTLNQVRKIFKIPFVEAVLVRYSQNKNFDSFIAKLLPSHYLYPKGSVREVNRNGINFSLDISDLVDWHVYFGLKEMAHERLYSLCNRNDIVIDIGTNIGGITAIGQNC